MKRLSISSVVLLCCLLNQAYADVLNYSITEDGLVMLNSALEIGSNSTAVTAPTSTDLPSHIEYKIRLRKVFASHAIEYKKLNESYSGVEVGHFAERSVEHIIDCHDLMVAALDEYLESPGSGGDDDESLRLMNTKFMVYFVAINDRIRFMEQIMSEKASYDGRKDVE